MYQIHIRMDPEPFNDLPGAIHWLNNNWGKEQTIWAVIHAAKEGYIDIIQWIHANRPDEGCSTLAMDWAAENGQTHIADWLREHGY